MKLLQLQVLVLCVFAASAYIPYKIVKKYAMKKMSESCFGEEVISNFREEMAAACDKCRGHDSEEQPELRSQIDSVLGVDDLSTTRRKRSAHYGKLTSEKLEKMRQRISDTVGNCTCVLKEMKMIDAENQIDLASIKERVKGMSLSEGLTQDLMEGMDRCSEFSSCLPSSVTDRNPLMKDFGKQMMFFKCVKMVKIESCMKQDFREDLLPTLVKDGVAADEEESFQTIIASSMLNEYGGY